MRRCGRSGSADEPRFQAALDELWPAAVAVLPKELRPRLAERMGRELPADLGGGRARHALGRVAAALGGDDRGAQVGSGGGVVTAEAVWEALGEVEDPEIPVISVVDLGVVRDVTVEDDRVHVEFTPTFLGCPALEVMRAQMAERIRALGAEPDVEVDPRRLVVDRPDHARRAARSCGRPASRRRRRARSPLRSSSNCGATRSAAPTAARARPGWRTSSALLLAALSATARAAANHSSSSRRSKGAPDGQ